MGDWRWLSPLLHFQPQFTLGLHHQSYREAINKSPSPDPQFLPRDSARRGIAIACRLSVRLSVCNVGGSRSHRLEILETNYTDN